MENYNREPRHFTYDVKKYNPDTHTLDFIRTDDYWYHPVKHTIMVIQRNGVKKLIRVKDDREFAYKMQKTQIKAKDGAEGLADFMDDEFWRDTAVKLLDYMMDEMKEATLQPWEY